MGKILIGTSGYSYTDWSGIFYPVDLSSKEFLSYYADLFPFVELNYSYYRMPEKGQLESMMNRVPDNFLFAIKGHRSFTLQRDGDWRSGALNFLQAVDVLLQTERLAAVLLQFPFSFHYSRENRIYLGQLCALMKELPLVIEFRNSEWLLPSVYKELEQRGIGYVITDLPNIQNLPEKDVRTTSDTGYIRFHGRNSESWWSGDSGTRYNYLYSHEELLSWVPDIETIAASVKRLFITFNNHLKGQAIRNARELRLILKKQEHLDLI